MAVLWLFCGCDADGWLFCATDLRDGCVVALMDSVLGYIVALILRDGCIVATIWCDAKSWL